MVTETRACRGCGLGKSECKCIKLMKGPQTDFYHSQAFHPALFAGRRSGKSVAGVNKAFAYIHQNPGAMGVITSPIAPQIRQTLMPVIRKFWGHVEGTEWELKVGDQEIHFSPQFKGSRIYLRPAIEPDAFRGMELAFFYMDEISSEHQLDSFMILVPALTQEGYPHQGWVTSTPDWRKPWIRRLWVEGVNPTTHDEIKKTDYPIFAAHMQDNFHLPEGFFEKQLALYGDTRRAAQELRGEFISVEGAAFPQFTESTHVRMPPLDTKWRRTVAGLDFGATSPTSLIEVRQDENSRLWVINEFYQRDAEDKDWVAAAGEWGLTKIVCDPSGGQRKADLLKSVYGVPIRLAHSNSFSLRASLVGNRLAIGADGPGLFIHPRCVNLIGELKNLAYDQPRGHDEPQDKWMSGSSDHAYDALAYAVMDFDKNPPDFTYRPTVVKSGWV